MDFVGNGAGGGGSLGIDIDSSHVVGGSSSPFANGATTTVVGNGGMGAENNPILYNEPNRTSAIDDIRSGVIYIFIITIFLCFFLIFPGIRNDKFPTFLCITTSLIVTSIILISLFGTTWHVADAPISAAYKAFSRDRIQGDLSVKIGLQSVNITLRAQKYYILHETRGPMIMFNSPALMAAATATASSTAAREQHHSLHPDDDIQVSEASKFIKPNDDNEKPAKSNSLADELLSDRNSDATAVDSELDADDEVFAHSKATGISRVTRSSNSSVMSGSSSIDMIQQQQQQQSKTNRKRDTGSMSVGGQRYTIKRVDVDINYNERFYWIEANQMAHEHQKALERGLPYPILTVVEYLSQDDGGFNWSRQYRSAGYYTYIILWLSLCVCALMFFLHCAAPKYGIYTMQVLGALLLFADLTYATLVPRGEQKLVIPFEGQSLTFRFGWSFWLVLIGGK